MSTTENLTATKSSGKTIDITLIALFAALMAICSWISIPLTVPFTLQTFAVFVTLEIIGGKRGTLSILVFLLLGAIGVPVFAGFKSGVAVLLGTTGGYLIGFLCTALIYWLFTSLLGNKFIVRLIALLLGLVVCYAFGTAWFMVVYMKSTGTIGLATVLGWCVTPFVIPDLVKLAVAFIISDRVTKVIKL